MNREADIIRLICQFFKDNQISYSPAKTANRCLIDFLNTELKIIKPVPRQIFISKEIKSKKIPFENFKALLDIDRKITNGEDIRYHQSTGIFRPNETDGLLNDWVIHHLHLSSWKNKPTDKFYGRTGLILFAIFTNEQAFFIDIRKHGKTGEPFLFGKKELLEIVDSNWPDLLLPYIMEDIIALEHELTDEEIVLSRVKGVFTGMTSLNNKILLNPGIGLSTTGHSVQTVRQAGFIMRAVSRTEEFIFSQNAVITNRINKILRCNLQSANFELVMLPNWPYFAFQEITTKYLIVTDGNCQLN